MIPRDIRSTLAISIRRRLTTLILLAVPLSFGCGESGTTLQRLWDADWKIVGVGDHWVRGVGLESARSFSTDETGWQFRSRVLNTGTGAGELVLSGGGRSERFTVSAGGFRDISIERLPTGAFEFASSVDLVLGEPRLVRTGDDASILVLVVADTLRDDAVGSATTPRILGAFGDGTRFTDVSANAPWTLPSMASMFTSLSIFDLTTPSGDLVGIPDRTDTLASTLRSAGYSCGAVVANPTVHVHNGFGQGFDTYLVPGIVSTKGGGPDATWVVHEAETWLTAHRGEKRFLYLHFMDPHEPYRDHEHGTPPPRLFELAHRMRTASADETERIRRLYGGEARHLDGILGPFLESLPASAVTVFTADHGEALGEHDCWGHGFTLYQPVTKVPLLVRAAGLAGGDDPRPISLIDLAPTVLEIMGQPVPTAMRGVSALRGGPPREIVAATFSPGTLRWMWRRGPHKVVVRTADQPLVHSDSRKPLQETEPLPTGVLYFDLRSDPRELNPTSTPPVLLPFVADAFARSVGSMVPGLQVFSVGAQDQAVFEISLPEQRPLRQIWSVTPASVSWDGPTVTVATPNSGIFSLVAIGNSDAPSSIRLRRAHPGWRHLSDGDTIAPQPLDAELGFVVAGTYVWWNPDRDVVVGSHDETVEKLKALGYIR